MEENGSSITFFWSEGAGVAPQPSFLSSYFPIFLLVVPREVQRTLLLLILLYPAGKRLPGLAPLSQVKTEFRTLPAPAQLPCQGTVVDEPANF